MRTDTMGQLVGSFWVILRYTHRHPVNRALHIAGMSLYILGIALMAGLLAGNSYVGAGALLLLAGVAMFTVCH